VIDVLVNALVLARQTDALEIDIDHLLAALEIVTDGEEIPSAIKGLSSRCRSAKDCFQVRQKQPYNPSGILDKLL
jgi:hypothetical protein